MQYEACLITYQLEHFLVKKTVYFVITSVLSQQLNDKSKVYLKTNYICSLCKPTFIRKDLISRSTGDYLVRNDFFPLTRFFSTRFGITPIRYRLVLGEKSSQQIGYIAKISHTQIKVGGFTVLISGTCMCNYIQ